MKKVRIFINKKAFANCCMVVLADAPTTFTETKGKVTICYNNDEVVGYNIVDKRFGGYDNGFHYANELNMSDVNACLLEAGLEALEADMDRRIVVGHVTSCVEHPDSDHLHVCMVDVGSETLQIVCGAANVACGQKVVVALDGAIMPNGKMIKNGALRGVKSFGMLCSEWELRLIHEPKRGILVLSDDAVVGTPFDGGKTNA